MDGSTFVLIKSTTNVVLYLFSTSGSILYFRTFESTFKKTLIMCCMRVLQYFRTKIVL